MQSTLTPLHKYWGVAVLLALTGSLQQAVAAPPASVEIPQGATDCSFNAWASRREQKPIPVRVAPLPSAKILGYLPNESEKEIAEDNAQGFDYYSPEFHVLEARSGWLRIDNITARSDAIEAGKRPNLLPLYRGSGWIPASAAQVAIQSSLGYSRPDAGSALLVDLKGDWLTEMGRINAIRACNGNEWLLLDYTITRSRQPDDALVELTGKNQVSGTAWFHGVCTVQETTCDMEDVDSKRDNRPPKP
jgi:hypothetical protein